MRIFSKLSRRFIYLILFCSFCGVPAFADFFDFKFTFRAAGVPPEAIDVRNFLVQNISGRTQILPLIGKDSDGTIASFRILSLPAAAAGKLYLNNVLVTANQFLTPAQAKNLQFEVMSSFNGPIASFTYTATDNEGLTDATAATYTIPVTTNGTLLVCSGGSLGTNILGAKGTFSPPYIKPNATVNCVNNNSSVAAPFQNLGNAPVPAITNYNYASSSNSLGPEGTYSFLKTLGTIGGARNCIKTDWVASDHTGDGGYAMIVNGSPNSGSFGKTFYQATTIAVCPNTLYEFSAYVINVLPGNHYAAVAGTEPNISFFINSQLVSTSGAIAYSTAATSFIPQWVKVGGLWYSGPNTSVDLRIDNATFVAGGNDLGLDDISLAICGPEITYPDISLTPKFCSYGVLPLKADVKASVNTYSSYIFQNSTDGGSTWTDMGTAKTGSPVYNSASQTYEYLAEYGDIPIDPSMNGYRYRLKVATESSNLSGTTCNISADKIITVSAFEKPVAGADIVGCNSSTTAKLVAAISGETWSTVSGNPAVASIDQSGNISGMSANGIYKFQLTNTSGCSDTVNVTRDQVKSAGTDVYICSPLDTYKLADAGTGYKWEKVTGNPADASINVTTGLITGMSADGIYRFILRSDFGGCTDEVSVTRTNITLSSTQTNVTCFGATTGAINLSPVGGTAPYTFSWSNAQTTEDLSGLASGSYTVTVTDANSCTATTTVTITQPAAALALTSTQTNITCFGASTGAINLSPTGGTAPYTFSWTGGATTEDLTGLASGSYMVTVTDANSCTATTTVTITQPPAALALSSTQTNVTCFGATTGAINLSPAGGTAPYTFSWTGGATTEDLTDLASGSYTVTVADANNCTATTTVTITQPPAALALSSTQTNVTCFGATTGTINLSPTGGTAPYTFSWTGGATTEDLTDLAAGSYTVTVTDANSCTATTTVTITQPAAALALTSTQTNVTCFGASTGAINLSPTGGTAPYTFSWTGGATTKDLTGLASGSYTVTVTDANNCTATSTVTITQPAAALTLSSTQTNITCFGASTGAINLSSTGGTAPYTFSWTGGATTEDLTGLASGSYTVTVTDASSCTATTTVTITQPAAALALTSIQTNITCFGASTGAINLSPVGGTAPYTFSWSNTQATEDLTGLASGSYTVTVTDANSCTATTTVTITQPAAALTLSSTQTNITCFGASTGGINLSPIGGTAPYTFSWNNAQTTEDLTGLASGSYTVTVTDANSCTATTTVTITQPVAALALTSTQTNITCFGASTGAINLSPVGGTAPYTFSWSNAQTTEDLSGLVSGSYTVTVTDANHCTATSTVTITQPAAALTLSSTQTNVTCFGASTGAINLSPAGGTAPYTFSWTGGATTEDLSGLASGSYTVTVTDANSCTATTTVTITQPAAALTLSSTQTNVTCFGASTGAINLSPIGGTAPYTFSWTGGATTEDLTGLASGSYTVTVTDANSCTATTTVTITQPAAALALTSTQTNITCFGASTGAINLSPTGGTAPYTFSWNNAHTTEDLTGLAAGSYTVIVTDASNCTATLTVTITQPVAALTLSSTQTNVTCFGTNTGTINLSPKGGVLPYAFSWTGGATTEDLTGLAAGTYTVTVTDGNNCTTAATITITQPSVVLSLSQVQTNVNCFGGNTGSINLTMIGGTAPYSYKWNNGQTTEDLAGLSAGTYNVQVTDANSCTAVATIAITQPAAPLSLAATQTNVICFGAGTGAVNLSPSGGTAPYSFSWSNGQTTEDLSALVAGAYTVKVTDANNCTATSTITITQPSSALSLNSTKTDVSCFGTNTGNINLSATGGTAPYTFNWSNAETTEDISGLAAGIYTVKVTDANECTAATTVTIVQAAAPLTLTSSQTNVTCFGSSTGAINLILAGGTAPYTFSWNNGQTSEDLNNVLAGEYSVTVRDAKGCVKIETVTISQPKSMAVSFTAKNATCANATDGSISAAITGGTAPYKISWNGNAGLAVTELKNIGAGVYEIQVTDAKGCIVTAKTEVSQGTCAPIARDDNFKINQGLMLSADVAPNDSDPQSAKLRFSKLTDPPNGKLLFDEDGKFSFMPDSGFAGRVNFSYQICNTTGACHTAKVSIHVNAYTIVNLTPELSSVREGKTVSVTARLVRPFEDDVTITVGYSGKAQKEKDYLVLNNDIRLKIPKGQIFTTEKMTFAAVHDAFEEGDEDIILTIKTVSDPDVHIGSGAVVIINDVYPPPPPTDKPQDEPDNVAILPDPLMSPNGDGDGNEFFAIQNIESFQDNEVHIFNRWGNELFALKNYNNSDKVFKGYANKGLLVNSELPLTDGVYYYIINTYSLALGKRVKQVNKGYLILKR